MELCTFAPPSKPILTPSSRLRSCCAAAALQVRSALQPAVSPASAAEFRAAAAPAAAVGQVIVAAALVDAEDVTTLAS